MPGQARIGLPGAIVDCTHSYFHGLKQEQASLREIQNHPAAQLQMRLKSRLGDDEDTVETSKNFSTFPDARFLDAITEITKAGGLSLECDFSGWFKVKAPQEVSAAMARAGKPRALSCS